MERLIRQTTLIDTLGILLPGSVLLLAVNYYGILNIALPWKALFEGGDIPMLIYFAGASYICGSVIHEVGAFVEKLAQRLLCKVNLHAEYWKEKAVQDAYRACFKKEPPVEGEAGKDIRSEQIKAGKEIFSYVQQGERDQRIVLFHAFYAMGRALALTLICVTILVVRSASDWKNAICPIVACLVGIVVFSCRWWHYESKCLDEAYRLFTQCNKQIE